MPRSKWGPMAGLVGGRICVSKQTTRPTLSTKASKPPNGEHSRRSDQTSISAGSIVAVHLLAPLMPLLRLKAHRGNRARIQPF